MKKVIEEEIQLEQLVPRRTGTGRIARWTQSLCLGRAAGRNRPDPPNQVKEKLCRGRCG